MGRYITKYCGINKKSKLEKGHPHIVILTLSAKRAVEIIRNLKNEKNGFKKVGKLFAKHLKTENQLEDIKNNAFKAVVGTPNRLNKLLESVNFLTKCQLIVIDGCRDSKTRTIFDIPECKDDLFSFLTNYFRNGMKLSIY